jgi:BirA family biotin operon repressor/biotin-[acetyl-CoA-carboxylase] ligase
LIATASAFGRPHRHYRVCESTNARARELAADGAPGGTVVTAGEQTAGRGRRGRRWAAPAGKALLYSAIVRPLEPRHGLLPVAVPIAVCEAIESLAPVECAIKWPNDVWVERRKCAGVLIEARPQDGWAVIGIGVNVAIEPNEFPADLRSPAVSIGRGIAVADALAAVNERLAVWVEADQGEVTSAFAERDALHGERISWEDGAGIAAGLAADGNLLVTTDGGETVSLGAGEVSLQPSS